MNNKKLFNAIVKISLLSMVLTMSFQVLPSSAATLVSVSDTMSRLKVGVAANHIIAFTTVAAVTAGQTIVFTFDPTGDLFDLSALVAADVTSVTGMTLVANVGACAAGINEVYAAISSGSPETVTLTVCAGDTVAAGPKSVTIGNNHIINPAAASTYAITIGGTMADSGSLDVPIILDDQVVITAEVQGVFSFALSANICQLGLLDASQVNKCSYISTVTTNGAGGYVATIVAVTDGTNEHLNADAAPAIFINDVADASVSFGTEEYGVNTTQDGNPGILSDADDTCTTGVGPEAASALTLTPQTYATAAGPVTGSAATLCHSASIDGTTPAGTYTQTVTLIATSTF